MVRLAIRAGLPPKLDLIHEPEAAAILCFVEDMEGRPRSPNSKDEAADVRSSSKVSGF